MPLPSSGPISLLDVQNEFTGSNPIALREYYRNFGGPVFNYSFNANIPAGTPNSSTNTISLANFYGTKRVPNVIANTIIGGPTLTTIAIPAGSWKANLTICGGGGGTGGTDFGFGDVNAGGGGGGGSAPSILYRCRLTSSVPTTLTFYVAGGGGYGANQVGNSGGGAGGYGWQYGGNGGNAGSGGASGAGGGGGGASAVIWNLPGQDVGLAIVGGGGGGGGGGRAITNPTSTSYGNGGIGRYNNYRYSGPDYTQASTIWINQTALWLGEFEPTTHPYRTAAVLFGQGGGTYGYFYPDGQVGGDHGGGGGGGAFAGHGGGIGTSANVVVRWVLVTNKDATQSWSPPNESYGLGGGSGNIFYQTDAGGLPGGSTLWNVEGYTTSSNGYSPSPAYGGVTAGGRYVNANGSPGGIGVYITDDLNSVTYIN